MQQADIINQPSRNVFWATKSAGNRRHDSRCKPPSYSADMNSTHVVHQSIAKPMMRTFAHCISAYSYRISLLKLQIHDRLISTSAPKALEATNELDDHRKALDTWLKEWKEDISRIREGNSIEDAEVADLLDIWAAFQYQHTALLMDQDCGSMTDIALQRYIEVIQVCGRLMQIQQARLRTLVQPTGHDDLCPVLPITWTMAHTIFSVGLSLGNIDKSQASNIMRIAGVERRCLMVLSRLEGDPTNLCSGFSEILEQLYQQRDTNAKSIVTC